MAGIAQFPQLPYLGTAAGGATIPLPAGWVGGALGLGLNDNGQVVGWGYNQSTQPQGFIATSAGAVPVPPSGAILEDINDSGQVVGGGRFGTAAGTTVVSGLGTGDKINSVGQIIGNVCGSTTCQPAFGTAAGVALIPLPTGWISATTEGLNNSGQLAGWLFNGTFQEAFIGTASRLTLIPLPPGASESQGLSINDFGVVAGTSDVGDWIWDPINGIQLLSNMVPAGDFIANGPAIINDEGQILDQVQSAHFDGYVLLTPIPEPSFVGLSGACLFLFAYLLRTSKQRHKRFSRIERI